MMQGPCVGPLHKDWVESRKYSNWCQEYLLNDVTFSVNAITYIIHLLLLNKEKNPY